MGRRGARGHDSGPSSLGAPGAQSPESLSSEAAWVLTHPTTGRSEKRQGLEGLALRLHHATRSHWQPSSRPLHGTPPCVSPAAEPSDSRPPRPRPGAGGPPGRGERSPPAALEVGRGCWSGSRQTQGPDSQGRCRGWCFTTDPPRPPCSSPQSQDLMSPGPIP